jgi:hypothetical protein
MIQITEIISRSEQGATRPFICRADDGGRYYVKGAGAGRKALIAEWIAGNIAREMGLPVPPFALAEVPVMLLRYSSRGDLAEMGSAPVFASRAVEFAEELRFEHVRRIPAEQQAWTLIFDCWVTNGDRMLSENGGNPNVLWTPGDGRMHLIDHNLAFENDPLPSLKDNHVFGPARTFWSGDFRATANARMRAAIQKVPEWWAALPEEWIDLAGISVNQIVEMLWRCDRDADILWA